MVPGDAQRVAVSHHGHHQLEHVYNARSAVHQVAYEHRLTPLRMGDANVRFAGGSVSRGRHLVSQASQQRGQLIVTTVYVSDDVERADFILAVGPGLGPLDDSRVHLLGGVEDIHVAKPFALEASYGAAQLLRLPAHDVGSELPVGASLVTLLADRHRQVQHDSRRQAVVVPRQLH